MSFISDEPIDSLVVGKTIRLKRLEQGLTLAQLADTIGRATSYLSGIENGRKDPKLVELTTIAAALDTSLNELLTPQTPTGREGLEIEWERAVRSHLYQQTGLPQFSMRKSVPDDVLAALVGLYGEWEKEHQNRAATPEEARRANTDLRYQMRERHNYFAELEELAHSLHAAIGHSSGPLSQRLASDLASHLGFSLHYVPDLPPATRSVTDSRHMRIYLPRTTQSDPRIVLLQALSAHALGLPPITTYRDFLHQRVEINYLASALLIDEKSAVTFLTEAKKKRELAVEDLRDHYAVTYETAAHRFTNLATEHLGIPVHFLKTSAAGTLYKAYENDGVLFPADPLGAVEGQSVCKKWSARQVFKQDDRLTPFHQYSDKPNGTYWCTSKIESTSRGDFSISVGTPFDHVKWFRGRETNRRGMSTCPDDSCCRVPPADLATKWKDNARPQSEMNTALIAAMPKGPTPGVDESAVLEFLEQHSPA